MNEILRKLAMSMLASYLSDPATLKALEAYVDGQVDGFVGEQADRLQGAASPFLKILGASLKDEKAKALLHQALNAEFEALYKVAVDQLGVGPTKDGAPRPNSIIWDN